MGSALGGLKDVVDIMELTLGLRVWLNQFMIGLEAAGDTGLKVGLLWPVPSWTYKQTYQSNVVLI